MIQRRYYFIALSMFKCIHGLSPVYLSDLITMSNDIAIRPTRASSSLLAMVPRVIIRYYKAIICILWSGNRWNALPKSVSINTFKKALKTHILQRCVNVG